MKCTKKIKAFTLSEMLVVLLITTIVVGLAFSVLNLVQQQMNGINGNYERNTAFNLFKQSLWMDFNRHDGVWYEQKNNELVFANNSMEVIYEIHKNYVIKKQDTFHIEITNLQFFYNGNEQGLGEIDALDLTLSKTQGSQRLFVFKKNAATGYLNQ